MGFFDRLIKNNFEKSMPKSVGLEKMSYPLVYVTRAVNGSATYIAPDGKERNIKTSTDDNVIVLVDQNDYDEKLLWCKKEPPKNRKGFEAYDSFLEPAYMRNLDISTVVTRGYLEFLKDDLPVVRFTSRDKGALCMAFGIKHCGRARALADTEINVHMFEEKYVIDVNEISRAYTKLAVEEEIRYACPGIVMHSEAEYGQVEYTDPNGEKKILETTDISAEKLNVFEGKAVDVYVSQLNYSDVAYTNMLHKLKGEELEPHKYCEEIEINNGGVNIDFDNTIDGVIEPFDGECYGISFTVDGIRRKISVAPYDNKLLEDGDVGGKVYIYKTSDGQYTYIADEFVMM